MIHDIEDLTRYVSQQRVKSTPKQRLQRLKKANLLQQNGTLNPNFYPKDVIRQSDKSTIK